MTGAQKTKRHMDGLRAVGGGRMSLRLKPGNATLLVALAADAGISREAWINLAIERAHAMSQQSERDKQVRVDHVRDWPLALQLLA